MNICKIIFWCILSDRMISDKRFEWLCLCVIWNGHHRGWKDSATTNHQVLSVFDFATVNSFDQQITGPIYARGVLFLTCWWLMFLTCYRCCCSITIGSSDHSSLLVVISLVQPVRNLCFSRIVFRNTKLVDLQFALQHRSCLSEWSGLI